MDNKDNINEENPSNTNEDLNNDKEQIEQQNENIEASEIETEQIETNEISEQTEEVEIQEQKSTEKPKLSLKEMFSNKRVRYGSFASVMTLAVIAIIVILNLIVSQLGVKFDLTKDKMFSLSEQTQNIVSALDKEVNIYPVYTKGYENTQFMEMLDKYKSLSDKIKIEAKDPNLNPAFIKKYTENNETISSGSIIVESGDRFKVLTPYDLVDYQFNAQIYDYQATGIALEPKVTGAIQYVTTDDLPIIYLLEGHSEPSLNESALTSLTNENYTVRSLNILTAGKIPEDTDMLLINPPARDYSQEEADIINEYLTKGGKAIFNLALYSMPLPNYEKVLANYGVRPQNMLILEGDRNNSLPGNPLYLIPNLDSHEITNPISDDKMLVILPVTQAIEELAQKNDSTKITPLLTTSKSSYAKRNINSQTVEKEADDIDGPFNLAVLIEDSWFNDSESYQSKIIVISSTNLLDFNAGIPTANMDFFMNSVNYLVDRQDSVAIRSKSLAMERLTLTANQGLILSAVSVIVIPAIIIVIGVVIWLRRRNK